MKALNQRVLELEKKVSTQSKEMATLKANA